jgi:hypothetical protein
MAEFLNADKLRRAKDVVLGLKGTPFTEESVEKRALNRALAEGAKPKSEEAVEAVYVLLGGALSGATKKTRKEALEASEDGSELLDEKSEGSEVEVVGGKKGGKRK